VDTHHLKLHHLTPPHPPPQKSGSIGPYITTFVGCYFNASSVKNDFLFFTYQGSEIKLNKSTDTFTLNEEAYAQVRQAIVEKLGTRAKRYVIDLDI
jgi:tRNA U34 5-methylaminomethyl-2-thiouridine-forming methyltransferase MnmC